MEFMSFTVLIRDEIEKRAGENDKVCLNDVRKNNGVVLCGLTVTQNNSISPTIYLNDYYEAYRDGHITLNYIINDVMETYNGNKANQSVDIEYFMDYENVKGSVVYKLINTNQNQDLLKEIPHIDFFDLSIIFQCLISKRNFGTVSLLIYNVHLKLWDITLNELYRTAHENTPRLFEYEIKSIQDSICELWNEECPELSLNAQKGIPIYVLSNKYRVEGAACMLYPDLIRDFAEALNSSLYIIPSSVHEVLLLSAGNMSEQDEIKRMIQEVNDTQVKKEEILSYSLYYYDRNRGKMVQL